MAGLGGQGGRGGWGGRTKKTGRLGRTGWRDWVAREDGAGRGRMGRTEWRDWAAGKDGAGRGRIEEDEGMAGPGGRSVVCVRAGSSLPCVLGSQQIPVMKNKNTRACLNKNRSLSFEYRTTYLMVITTAFYVRC